MSSIQKISKQENLSGLRECQLPCLPRVAEGKAAAGLQPFPMLLKQSLAKPWNYIVKKWLKRLYRWLSSFRIIRTKQTPPEKQRNISTASLHTGDQVRVRSREEIEATLDRFKEFKGCAFLEYMWQYCGTTQRVLQPMERFLDERDYQVKSSRGIVLLENVICRGTPVFGRCDRACHLFWRVEWLEKLDQ